MTRAHAASSLLLCLLLPACSAPLERLNLAVESQQPDGSWQAMPDAGVRAVTLRAGVVPLPLNPETLEELLTVQMQSTSTDEDGRASLNVDASNPQLIEILPPPLGPGADTGRWAWVIQTDGTMAPAPDLTIRGEREVRLLVR